MGQINQSTRAALHKEVRMQAMKLLLTVTIISVDITAIRKIKIDVLCINFQSVQNPGKLGCIR